MLNRLLSLGIGYFTTNNYTEGSTIGQWLLETGFWDDTRVWLDEELWNDG